MHEPIDISKQLDQKLKEKGFELNKHSYRYGKRIDDATYINAFYDNRKGLYKIGGIQKFQSPLGGSSSGITWAFNNEADFWKKINEYLGETYAKGGNLEDSEKSCNFVKQLINGEISHDIEGESNKSKNSLIKATFDYLRRTKQADSKGGGYEPPFKKEETARLKDYSTKNNLWIDPKPYQNRLPNGQGFEQKVYFDSDTYVIKLNNGTAYNSWEDYLTSLLLHNYFFPDTTYELIGFIELDNEFRFAVKQQLIAENDELTDLNSVQKVMFENGFLPNRDNNYDYPELCIEVRDLHDRNVLTVDGNLYFIDTIFKVKDSEQFKQGGKIKTKEDAIAAAEEFLRNLPTAELESLKNKIRTTLKERLIEEEVILDKLLFDEKVINDKIQTLYEKDKVTIDSKEKMVISDERRALREQLQNRASKILNQTNIVGCLRNGGALVEFTDKKGLVHSNIPDYRNINTDFIGFDEETILTDAVPGYVPKINEEKFKSKGYIFDVIRIEPDGYLVAVNGYSEEGFEKRGFSYEKTGKHPEDFDQGYIIVTLDQLALINEYYYTKAKALNQKDADEQNKRVIAYYDSLPREKRDKHLNQPGFYRALPVAVKKKITEEKWNTLTLEEKESFYKPVKHYGAKRLVSKLDDKHMWISFHDMFNRFVNADALPYKGRDAYKLFEQGFYTKESAEIAAQKSPNTTYGHPLAFEYWHVFSEFLNWKIKDIKVQRETISEMRKLAIETSFGESNTNDALKSEYGILVKRQDGSKITPTDIDQISKAWQQINKTFGNLKDLASTNNLKISHTGNKYVFASKAAGMYVPDMQTIAVSNKFGDNQFNSIFAHETAHWIDNKLGQSQNKRYATDDYESISGQIAIAFRKNMNEASDSDYTNSSKECFSRAFEEFFSIENYGNEATLVYSNKPLDGVRTYFSEKDYVGKPAFESKIKPLIEKFLTINRDFLNFAV